MAAGIGAEADQSCSAFDWSSEANERSTAWSEYIQAFKREHDIFNRPLTDTEISQLDGEFQALLDPPPVET